eukprot:NODE_34_length_2296_cov_444.940526_g33_i0.p1 GENE.NODE_34_length_2296_cov_444.940526_g33_i0~~NODE_34_length_2296_cov_444.940526_g33_i0.p1  ORF type:complete len:722 (-),score=164.21 NODE_34_length_2296_cov_444.940526_g33_i0:54-2219(-)
MYMLCIFYIIIFIILTDTQQDDVVPAWWKSGYEKGSFLYSTEANPANRPQVGNGYVATFVATETEYIAGVFNGIGTKTPSHRARIPASTNIGVTYNGTELTPVAWGLDLQTAIAYRLYSAENCTITQTWYAHRTLRHAIIMSVTFDNTQGHQALEFSFINHGGGVSKDLTITNNTKYGFTAQTKLPEEPTTPLTSLCVATTPTQGNTVKVNSHSTTTSYIISVRYTSLSKDHEYIPYSGSTTLWDTCWANYEKLTKADKSQLLREHTTAWSYLWDSRIEIDGDMQLARIVNASVYALLNGIRADWPYSTSPGGLPTDGYHGHTFWDVETWMYPSIALLWPKIAQGSIIQYRFIRIPGAEKKAKNNNYLGAMYPWESAFTGQEVCPSWAPTGKYEQHITGDIAVAMWQYYSLTLDEMWLENVGYPMLYKMCEFWASRVSGNNTSGYSINDIIPPDEYHSHVNNSVYTNIVAKLTFQYAMESAKVLKKTVPSHWDDIMKYLIVLFDKQRQAHPEFAGYFKLPSKQQIVKQADVILLPYPLLYSMAKPIAANDLNWYGPVTSPNGPAMTWSMFCVGYLHVGDYKKGDQYFSKGYKQYIQAPFNQWWEVKAGSGTANFLTGAGGFLQSLYAGWMGLRIGVGVITLLPPPTLPTGVDGILLRGVSFLGNEISLHSKGGTFTISASYTSPSTPAVVCQNGVPHALPFHTTVPFSSPITLVQHGECKP